MGIMRRQSHVQHKGLKKHGNADPIGSIALDMAHSNCT
jgi:hypothetical protein